MNNLAMFCVVLLFAVAALTIFMWKEEVLLIHPKHTQDFDFGHVMLEEDEDVSVPTFNTTEPVIIVTANTEALPRKLPENFELGKTVLDVFSIFALATEIYANHFNYKVVRYVYKTSNKSPKATCEHVRFGKRHASWCKVLAMYVAIKQLRLEKWDRFLLIWMDNDSSFEQMIGVHEFLNSVPINIYNCKTDACIQHKNEASLLFFFNKPWRGERAIASNFMVRNKSGVALLKSWWNLNFCKTEFPWEQRALNTILYPLSFIIPEKIGGTITTLSVTSNTYDEGGFVSHWGHTIRRERRMQGAYLVLQRLLNKTQQNPEQIDFYKVYETARKNQIALSDEELLKYSEEMSAGVENLESYLSDLLSLVVNKTNGVNDNGMYFTQGNVNAINKSECIWLNYARDNKGVALRN